MCAQLLFVITQNIGRRLTPSSMQWSESGFGLQATGMEAADIATTDPSPNLPVIVISEQVHSPHDASRFPVTAARAWNALPSSVRSMPSLLQFCGDLKTALFQSSHSSS